LALQEGGTAAWELAAMQAAGIDAAHGVTITVRQVADSRAGQVALQAGEVDAILSDFIWVSAQRHQGADFTFVPHSLAVGGLMVMPNGPVAQIADLAGKSLGVAGGPSDKSYVILQALYSAQTGRVLADDISAKFGAPPLINELLAKGEVQAALNFWHFNVRAALAGARPLITVKAMLAGLGVSRQPPLLGWVFHESAGQSDAVTRYIDASFATKAALLADDALWLKIRPAMQGADDDALFTALRDAYRVGIVSEYGSADVQAATETFALLAKYGGPDVVGNAPTLAPGSFWRGKA